VVRYLNNEKQKQLLGEGDEGVLGDGEEQLVNFVERYDRDVLQLYLLAASSGCFEAGRAMTAYLEYGRIMQLLGLAEDPRFQRPIPEELFDTRWNLCAAEEFERCQQTGDFPHLVHFLVGVYKQETDFGLPERPQAQGIEYLRRCGHWNARIDAFVQNGVGGRPAVIEEVATDIPIQWQQGSGPFGVFGATISGQQDLDIKQEFDSVYCFEFFTDGSTNNYTTVTPASAVITGLSFDQPPWYLPGTPPLPRSLEVQFDLGQFTFMSQFCQPTPGVGNPDTVVWGIHYDNLAGITNVLQTKHQGKVHPGDVNSKLWSIKKGWEFDDSPYRAEIPQSDNANSGGVQWTARLVVVVEHTPQ